MITASNDALLLARLQFAFTVSFHIIFPAISIGLANYLAVLEGLWLRTQRPVYRDLFFYWLKIFAVGVGVGVVSGVVMSYEFGANWSNFSRVAGAVTGPLVAYEVLTAFFLEAGFLGIMLFGWTRVGPRMHFFATVGTPISAFWILAPNSWMQTPQGFAMVGGRVEPLDWFAIVFNPSSTTSGDAAVNDCTLQPLTHDLPFGGVGKSGMGKYHGEWGFHAYTNARGVLHHSTRPDPAVRYPPYDQNTTMRALVAHLAS
jgi:hypothetical protein